MPETLAVERAILVEPLADCLHAVHDQAKIGAGDRLVVIAAGVMGLKIVVEAARIGAKVLVVEPLEERRRLALEFGAELAIDAAEWRQQTKEWAKAEGGVHAVILTIGNPDLVNDCIAACRPGGRVVLFAGFGNRPQGMINLNDIHYREIVLVGSEWIGTPPNQVRKRYDLALDLLNDPNYPFEKLVTGTCGFDDVESALVQRQTFQGLKTMFVPRPAQ
jgi:L-iditol 2-dehydrogenase